MTVRRRTTDMPKGKQAVEKRKKAEERKKNGSKPVRKRTPKKKTTK